jgi:OmpA-OmpF porin, OOP family
MRTRRPRGVPCPWAFFASVAATVLLAAPRASAQAGATGAIEQFEPTPAGDAFFGVPSPSVGGDFVLRAKAVFDYAYKPLSIQDQNGNRFVIVSDQAFLHANLSLALWDRVLVSADMPFALAQGGSSPVVAGATFPSPSGADVGDLRLGARLRVFGDFWDPFQVGVGGYVFLPTAPANTYAGDGSVRGEPQLVLGGRFEHFVWSAMAGTTVRASEHPSTFDAGAGAALVLGEDLVQIGPELTLATPFKQDTSFSTPTTQIVLASSTEAELLMAAKVRVLHDFVVGAGAGPGLTHGYGVPVAFAVGQIGYEPLPPRVPVKPPPPDRDGDGIPDSEDNCPDKAGPPNADPKKNGCPPDRDGDGIPDSEDNCPDKPGVPSGDPKQNGCPPDRDGDGIPDSEDNCPDKAGVRNADPKLNGCPPDADGDGIPDMEDACPHVKGSQDDDPSKNGCPHVKVTPTEIAISSQVKFLFGRFTITQTVDPVSDGLLTEVRNAIQEHPEISLIEVQGHTDNVGPDAYNEYLSLARANAVRDWLIGRGIPGGKLIAKGYGKRKPLGENVSEAGRQANRRVQFMIIKGTPAP